MLLVSIGVLAAMAVVGVCGAIVVQRAEKEYPAIKAGINTLCNELKQGLETVHEVITNRHGEVTDVLNLVKSALIAQRQSALQSQTTLESRLKSIETSFKNLDAHLTSSHTQLAVLNQHFAPMLDRALAGWVAGDEPELLKQIGQLIASPVWAAARSAVERVAADRKLQQAAGLEEKTSFCPRCGQIPDGDRRMEEAREAALAGLSPAPSRSDLDFALAFHYWRLKRNG